MSQRFLVRWHWALNHLSECTNELDKRNPGFSFWHSCSLEPIDYLGLLSSIRYVSTTKGFEESRSTLVIEVTNIIIELLAHLHRHHCYCRDYVYIGYSFILNS